jgi:hypothetical protein
MDTYMSHTCQVEQCGAGYVSSGSILQRLGHVEHVERIMWHTWNRDVPDTMMS